MGINKVDCIIQANSKHEHNDLIPAEVANVGVRVACVASISDVCQKNTEVIILADCAKYTAERSGTNNPEVGK